MIVVACSGSKANAPNGARDWSEKSVSLEKQPPWVIPGERATYRVTAHKVELAAFTLAVGDVATFRDRPAVPVQAGIQTAGLAALVKKVTVEFTAWIDAANGQSLLFTVTESAGKGDDTVEKAEARFTELASGKFPVAYQRPGAAEVVEQQTVLGQPTDLISLLVSLRAWDGKPGDKRVLDAVRNRYIWRTQVTLAARESVVTELGEFPAVRFDAASRRLMRDGTFDPGQVMRRFTVWISDDADRVPLKLVAESDYGDIEMDIVDYAAGTAPNLARPK